jgi:hypothetical protein
MIIELAKLENNYPQNISNYHFDVQVAGEELVFRLQMKEGYLYQFKCLFADEENRH